MGYFRPIPAAITELLVGPSGPVYRHVAAFTRKVEEIAKERVPVDTGALRNSIHSLGPFQEGLNLRSEVRANAFLPARRRGANPDYTSYALVVHEGHGTIYARPNSVMKFRPKSYRGQKAFRGQYVYTTTVAPTPGVRYLYKALTEVNNNLLTGATAFAIIPGDDLTHGVTP